MRAKEYYTLATIISITLVIISFIVANALGNIRKAERFVSVRGLAEKQVIADQALWPLNFRATGSTLSEIYAKVESSQKHTLKFLKDQGFTDEEIHVKQVNIQDTSTNTYSQRETVRYIADAGVLIRSDKIKLIKDSLQQTNKLIAKGVSLSSGSVEYTFEKLNDIKPEMIEEATKEALKAAKRFAKDSGSKVSKIRRAHQGLFTIDSLHYYTPEIKKIRVVIDMEYSIN